jgi:hypothetical protein
MLRQISVVALGILLSFLAVPASGYVLYRLSSVIPQEATLGQLARYIVDPVIALLVGTCVGALARSWPKTLATFSLAPWAFSFLFSSRQHVSHLPFFVFLALVYLLIGIAAAAVAFRARTKSREGLHAI